MARPSKPLRERFEAKFTRADGCWLWTASLVTNGYGGIVRNGYNKGGLLAHRVSWELYRGPIPEGMQVLHKCDTPACVNPDHLFLGTPLDNMRDKIAKGRGNNGVTKPRALTERSDR